LPLQVFSRSVNLGFFSGEVLLLKVFFRLIFSPFHDDLAELRLTHLSLPLLYSPDMLTRVLDNCRLTLPGRYDDGLRHSLFVAVFFSSDLFGWLLRLVDRQAGIQAPQFNDLLLFAPSADGDCSLLLAWFFVLSHLIL